MNKVKFYEKLYKVTFVFFIVFLSFVKSFLDYLCLLGLAFLVFYTTSNSVATLKATGFVTSNFLLLSSIIVGINFAYRLAMSFNAIRKENKELKETKKN